MLFYKEEREKSKERRLNREERKGERGGERENSEERRKDIIVCRTRQTKVTATSVMVCMRIMARG